MKPIKLYRISRGYKKVTVWNGSRMTQSVTSISTVTPKQGLTRRQRYNVIAEELFKTFGIPAPCYRATKAESA